MPRVARKFEFRKKTPAPKVPETEPCPGLKPCPFCGTELMEVCNRRLPWALGRLPLCVRCPGCAATGPWCPDEFRTRDERLAYLREAWDERARKKPVTRVLTTEGECHVGPESKSR